MIDLKNKSSRTSTLLRWRELAAFRHFTPKPLTISPLGLLPLCFLLALLSSYLLAPPPAEAESLYKIYGKNGRVTFSTKRPRGRKNFKRLRNSDFKFSKVRKSKIYRGKSWNFYPIKSAFDPLILKISREKNVSPALVKAVIHVESAFNEKAKSPKGASGLMQLMPQTAERFGVERIWEPEQNIRGGVSYLSWLDKKFNGDIIKVLASYNAGENAVLRYGGVPPYLETQQYVKRVKRALNGYKKANFQ